ncbi:anthocyanidin 3-O-glucosyltransferase 2-like [Syzygium oleosum]|uniref:anthocyanidin 3-O-glucosyltransferase 2-like n=1 Tax=Syzygium oleosum TaxID=219896 RepID=UPI0024B99C05|nr:anthocyanidin 3-O-glucosyltransferase 2-like [Syzygium oleosum]
MADIIRCPYSDMPKQWDRYLAPAEFAFNNSVNRSTESNKPHVKWMVVELAELAGSTGRLAGFVLDTFCTTMIDLADEFRVPSYVFFMSSVAFLGLMLHLQLPQDENHMDMTEFKDPIGELDFSSFTNPLLAKVLPTLVLMKDAVEMFLEHTKRMRATKAIVVNTFNELDSHAVRSLAGLWAPAVYPVGPILNLKGETKKKANSGRGGDDIMEWLDKQRPSLVVFLCFGSKGSFGNDQMKEMVCTLEWNGHRSLWSLRLLPPNGKNWYLRDYKDSTEVLPEGFLDQTSGIGKVIGWATQAAVLAHPAIGGFVSHCEWHSTIKRIWFGVAMATWPLYAEQQFNSFELVVELGLAAEIRMDYRRDLGMESDVVTTDEIKAGIRKLMEEAGDNRRKKVSVKSRKALVKGESFYLSLGRLIDDISNNAP